MISSPFSLDRLAGVLAVAAGLLVAAGPACADGPFNYYALTPCRTVDTRYTPGAPGAPPLVAGNGSPALQGNGTARNFQIRDICGIPTVAKAVSINLTVVTPFVSSPGNFITIWPSGGPMPVVSTLNFVPGEVALANGAVVPLSSATQDLSVYCAAAGTAHVLIDINGYFAP